MKKVIFILLATAMLCTARNTYAQTATTKVVSATEATPANVLKWTKEVLPKMELLMPKLEKIIASNNSQEAQALRGEAANIKAFINHLKEINAKGTGLTATEARKQDKWLRSAMLKGLDDCLTANPGSECCFGCKNGGGSGYGNFWCLTNCFVVRFPGID